VIRFDRLRKAYGPLLAVDDLTFTVDAGSVFGFLGLALAVIGVYGVMSTTVAQQRHEIGVRMALGAGSGTIARMVVVRGSRLLLLGMATGLIGSIVVAQLPVGALPAIAL